MGSNDKIIIDELLGLNKEQPKKPAWVEALMDAQDTFRDAKQETTPEMVDSLTRLGFAFLRLSDQLKNEPKQFEKHDG